ncbi:MAG: TonB-dependent receptor [Neisseria sp.]|nr:TonB-dependent receptor [Neisseria sp.]
MTFKKLPLTTAVLGALFSAQAFADTAPKSVELDTVTVTASQGVKVKTNLVTTRAKDESTETDLRGLFKGEPAIGMGGGNGTSQYLYIRNMGQNSVDVKVDNAYSDSQIHYHQGRHMLDPSMVKIVAVQKGAGSASAGIGQTNGAVIAKTLDAQDLLKNSSNPNFGGKIHAGFNSNDGHSYGGSVFGQNEKIDFVLSANRVNEDEYKAGKGYENGINKGKNVPFSALDKVAYLAKFGIKAGDNHRFVISHLHEQHKGNRLVREEFPADEFTVDSKGQKRLSLARQAPAERKMTVDNTNLEWNATNLGFAEAANANVYRLVHGRWSAQDTDNNYASGNNNKKYPKIELAGSKIKVQTTGANVNFDSRVFENEQADVLLKYGVNFRHQKVKPHAIYLEGLGNQEKRDTGIYTEAITEIKPANLTLTTGLRYDHFDFKAMDGKKRSDGAVNPSVGVVWEAVSGLKFSASHNYATRSPRMHDAIMSHGKRGVVSINSNTKAEKARNTEIGFNYDNGMFNAEGSYFWQNIGKALGTDKKRNNHLCADGNDECYAEIINAGKIKNSGYELGAGVRYAGLTARLGVAHSKPKFTGSNLNANPEYAIRAGRTWTASLAYRFNKPNLEVGIQHRHVEKVKKEDSFILAHQQVTKDDKDRAAYGVTDISANWKPLNNDKLNVNAAINNVFNKHYLAHTQRNSSTLPGTGREFRVGVNYTF